MKCNNRFKVALVSCNMADYRVEFYEARWHLDVAKRMLEVYDEYSEKRVLVGVIREAAKAAGKLVRSFLVRENVKGDLGIFVRNVAPRYLDAGAIRDLVRLLELERDQGRSKVEFARKDKVLLEVDGGWRILKVSRLRELVDNVNDIVDNFPTGIKR